MTAPPRISPDEYVVTAWAEYASGPGWSNGLVLALARWRKVAGGKK